MSKKYYKCLDCLFKKKNGYCVKRSLMTDYKLIRAWGCDNYKPKYESLLDEYYTELKDGVNRVNKVFGTNITVKRTHKRKGN